MGGSPTWNRADHLDRLRGEFDVLVIGGGIVGAGTALDAVSRGLSVAVVERADWASGTSSRSTKLLHGGVRYLPQLRFRLIREGLKEQRVLARTADYLFEPIDFVIPVYRDRGFADAPRWARHPRIFPWTLRLGLWFYDRLGSRPWRTKRRIDATAVRRLFPLLRPEGLRHGVVYGDAQTDDARLTLMVTRTAVDRGAVAVNHVEALDLEPTATGWRIELRDTLDGGSRAISAGAVVAATGADAPPGHEGETLPVVLSKGTHLITRQEDIGVSDAALVLPETDDGRVLFIVPWRQHAVVGTTDTPYEGDPEHPTATADDIAYLQRHRSEYLDAPEFEPLSAWSGLRALATGGRKGTAQASRAHRLVDVAPGYVQVAGGKLTGYRVIAAEVTDRIARHLGNRQTSTTEQIGLHGSGLPDGFLAEITDRVLALDLPEKCAAPLVARYGTEAGTVLALAESDPRLAETIDGRWLLAEVAHSARMESTATIADFVQRRTRIAWFTTDHAREALPAVGQVLADELGWDERRLESEITRADYELATEGL